MGVRINATAGRPARMADRLARAGPVSGCGKIATPEVMPAVAACVTVARAWFEP